MMQITQDAITRLEMLQQAVRRLGQLEEFFFEQLRTHEEPVGVLPLFIVYVLLTFRVFY